jgi:hypothetical protein
MNMPTPASRHLDARESLASDELRQLWRVVSGVLRVDSAPKGEPARFVHLALPGDVVGVERWVGSNDSLRLRAVIATELAPVDATGDAMMHILMETVVVAHQRCREVVSLRSGPAARRIQALLLMFAQSGVAQGVDEELAPQSFAVPHLSDLSAILDIAPETASRAFTSMRSGDFLAERRPQKARLRSQVTRGIAAVAEVSAGLVPASKSGLAI